MKEVNDPDWKIIAKDTGGIMKADYWRQGVAAILAAGLLAVSAVAQDGAEGEVNIKDSEPTETTQSEQPEAAPDPKPIKPQIVDRDPFVNQLLTGNVIPTNTDSRPPTRTIKPRPQGGDDGDNQTAAAPPPAAGDDTEEEEEVEIPAPDVNVTGIVSSGSGNQAIIKTNVGMKVINVGQKLGDYHVASIGQNHVVFSYGGEKTFKVGIDKEF